MQKNEKCKMQNETPRFLTHPCFPSLTKGGPRRSRHGEPNSRSEKGGFSLGILLALRSAQPTNSPADGPAFCGTRSGVNCVVHSPNLHGTGPRERGCFYSHFKERREYKETERGLSFAWCATSPPHFVFPPLRLRRGGFAPAKGVRSLPLPSQRCLLVLGSGVGLMLVQGKGVMHYAPTNSCLQQSQSPLPSASRHPPPCGGVRRDKLPAHTPAHLSARPWRPFDSRIVHRLNHFGCPRVIVISGPHSL